MNKNTTSSLLLAVVLALPAVSQAQVIRKPIVGAVSAVRAKAALSAAVDKAASILGLTVSGDKKKLVEVVGQYIDINPGEADKIRHLQN